MWLQRVISDKYRAAIKPDIVNPSVSHATQTRFSEKIFEKKKVDRQQIKSGLVPFDRHLWMLTKTSIGSERTIGSSITAMASDPNSGSSFFTLKP